MSERLRQARSGTERSERGPRTVQALARQVELQRRLAKGLGKVSQLLAGPGTQPLQEVLRAIGTAARAACVYIVIFPPVADVLSRASSGRKGLYTLVWHREGRDAEAQWLLRADTTTEPTLHVLAPNEPDPGWMSSSATGWAVPILAADDTLHAYLGFEYASPLRRLIADEVQALTMLRGLLASYFERRLTEEAWRESEKRWRKLVDAHPDPILITIGEVLQYANQAAIDLLGAPSLDALIDRTLHDFVSADMADHLDERLDLLEQGHNVDHHEHEVIGLDGRQRIVEATAVATTYGRERAILTVWRDVTRLRESEERYRTFIETISEAICRFRLDAPVFQHAAPEVQRRHLRAHARLEGCNNVMAELLLQLGDPAVAGTRLGDCILFDDPRLLREFIESGYRLHNWRHAVRDADGTVRHVIMNAVGAQHRDRITSIWWSCVEITERIDLENRMVEALEQQQDRIGRDLHDGVGQLLTAIRMMSSNLAAQCEVLPDDVLQRARRVASFAVEASDRVAEIHRGLVPVSLYQNGLAVGLSSLADSFQDVSEVACTFHYDGKTHVEDKEAALQLFRIAQEAVNNAMKYAEAGQVVIDLSSTEQAVILEVRDDGKGFDQALPPTESLGLNSMRYRAHILGATYDIRSAPGAGTTVRCVLPQ